MESKRDFIFKAMGEFLGILILMIFGMGSVAQFVLSNGITGSADQVRWAWGFGVTFGVYVAFNISGAHLNPAVTLTMCCFKGFPLQCLPFYWLAQYLGAFCASAIVHAVYYDAIESFNGGNKTIETASIFATYPQSYLSWGNGLSDQVCGTAVLMVIIFALTDPKNTRPAPGYFPLLIGLSVVAIGMALGHNCGYAINPARDLGPRLYTLMSGWGVQVFSHNNFKWFWIPIIGPHIGALIGGALYELLVNRRLPWHQSTESENGK